MTQSVLHYIAPKSVNKLRYKYIYYDNARSQLNVKWGEVYAMNEAPPGVAAHTAMNIGRGDDTPEGRTDLDRFEDHHRSDPDNYDLEWKRTEPGHEAGRSDEAYTWDSIRWSEQEKAEVGESADDWEME